MIMTCPCGGETFSGKLNAGGLKCDTCGAPISAAFLSFRTDEVLDWYQASVSFGSLITPNEKQA